MYWKESLFLHTTEIMILKQERSLKISFQMTCTFKLKKNTLKWPKKLKLIPKNYHVKAFERNAHRKLSKDSDTLNDPEV